MQKAIAVSRLKSFTGQIENHNAKKLKEIQLWHYASITNKYVTCHSTGQRLGRNPGLRGGNKINTGKKPLFVKLIQCFQVLLEAINCLMR